MINTQETSQITKIYLVTNCFGDPNKVYIGKEKYPQFYNNKRKYIHKMKFGKDIIFTYIDEIQSLQSKDWKPFESFWIEYFRQLGFDIQNKNGGGGGPSNHSLSTKEKISKRKLILSLPIIQYSLNGDIIKLWNNIIEASNNTNLPYKNIYCCCNGKSKTSGDYIWRYKNDPLPLDYKLPKHKLCKILLQYDLEGNFIREFDGGAVQAVKELGKGNPIIINDCARGKSKSIYGFKWKYK